MSNQSESELDFTIPKFPAPLRKWLASDVTVSYKVKCVLIGPFLYLLGALVSFFAGTFSEYLWSYPTCLAFVTSSLALCVLVYACKQVVPTINGVAATMGHSTNDEFMTFISTLKTERTWRGKRIRYWYYLHIILFTVAFMVAAYFGLFGPPIWVLSATPNVSWMIQIYYYLVAAPALGYVVGNCFDLGMEYAFLVNYYSKNFVKDNFVKLFPPEEIGGLRPMGNLAWKVDIAAVIPVIFGLSLLLDNWIREGITLLDRPGSILILILYVLFLAVLFVYPIWPSAHCLIVGKEKGNCSIKSFNQREV